MKTININIVNNDTELTCKSLLALYKRLQQNGHHPSSESSTPSCLRCSAENPPNLPHTLSVGQSRIMLNGRLPRTTFTCITNLHSNVRLCYILLKLNMIFKLFFLTQLRYVIPKVCGHLTIVYPIPKPWPITASNICFPVELGTW